MRTDHATLVTALVLTLALTLVAGLLLMLLTHTLLSDRPYAPPVLTPAPYTATVQPYGWSCCENCPVGVRGSC